MGLLRSLLPGGRPLAQTLFPGSLPAGMKVGAWRIVRRLGEGGNGTVYLVKRWGRSYALKIAMRPGDKRLQREGQLLRRMHHPAWVKLRGQGWWLGREKGFPYLVMDYVEGLSLYAWVRSAHPTPRQLAELVAQAAEALEAVHREDSLHRDVKGTNILVRPGGRELMMLDLGAGGYDGATPITSHVLPPATELYLSPEAMAYVQAHASDSRARYKARPADDLYALGVMAYRALTGEYPFPSDIQRDLFWLAVQAVAAPDMRERNPRVPAELAAIVHRLLAKKPEERYARAQSVAEAVRQAAREGGPDWDKLLFEGNPEVGHPSRKGPPEAALEKEYPRGRLRGWVTVAWMLMLTMALGMATHAWLRDAKDPEPERPQASTFEAVSGHPTPEVGIPNWEVAQAEGALNAGTGAVASDDGASTPVPIAPAIRPKEDTRMNPPVPSAPSAASEPLPPKSKSPLRGIKSFAPVLPLCIGVACASAPTVRPLPPPEECPPGAIEAMKNVGLKIGTLTPAFFVGYEPEGHHHAIPVQEGKAEVIAWPVIGGRPPQSLRLSGRLIFGGDRVYGRFTEARPERGGPSFPVCIEVRGLDFERGMLREPGSTENNVMVLGVQDVKMVERFK
ncbi:serine/threonine protein kinase [Hyalangium versicolor]|uniref:serine/threonine protein kinase n=1 Tax=Hyalangium versicolor TaxID=2861190 RepID=UPI001CCDFBFC|nr:serine/threonine-protein kinase [Hyalangium versicolor]